MTVVSFPVIQQPRNWLYHFQVMTTGGIAQLYSELRRDEEWRDRQLSERLKLSHMSFDVVVREFVPQRNPPAWARKFRRTPPEGNSYELALAVGLRAAAAGVSLPSWVTFTGAIALDKPGVLRFDKTGAILMKVRLALGLDGHEEHDPLKEAFDTHQEECIQTLGEWASRTRPGHVRLMFVPAIGLEEASRAETCIQKLMLTERLPVDVEKVAGLDWSEVGAWLEGRFGIVDTNAHETRRMLVIGADSVEQVLGFLRLNDDASAEVLQACVVGYSHSDTPPFTDPAPHEPEGESRTAVEEVTVRLPDARSGPSATFRFCRLPVIHDSRVMCLLEDAVSEEQFTALIQDHSPPRSRYPWPNRRLMTADEAAARSDRWIQTWHDRLLERPADNDSSPFACRLPTVSEWKAAVTDEELIDPAISSHFAPDGPAPTGTTVAGAQRRIQPNANGLCNLLGNVPELVRAEDDEDTLMLAGFPNDPIPTCPLSRDALPINQFHGRGACSFRLLLEFRNQQHWQSFCDARESSL